MSKRFHISTILTITTGRFVAIDEKTNELDFDLVYQILNYMTSDNLYTHQLPLPRASDECKPYLLDQFPQLVGETGEGVGSESKPGKHWLQWVKECVDKYGAWFDVEPIPMDDHTVIHQ